jgi:ABC-type transporter MlaC component
MMYAREFKDYHGETFAIVNEAADKRGGRIVRTEMRVPGGSTVHFDYLLHQVGDRWSIINTNFDGVSGLSMDRSRYEPLLRNRGPDELISQLRAAASGTAPAGE